MKLMKPSTPSTSTTFAARSSRSAVALAVAAALLCGSAPVALAGDQVPTMIGNLEKGSDYKVRLSAAIGLTNQADQRAVVPMTKALSDADKNVRAAAASGLGKLVTAATKAADKAKALVELDRVAKGDASSSVKTAAAKAAAAIRALGAAGTTAVSTGGIFIDLKSFAAGAGTGSPALLARMGRTAKKSVDKQRVMTSGVMSAWPGGKVPTAKDLSAASVDGFQVTGTLVSLTTATSGAAATVKCEVKLVIATYPAASMFGFLNSNASVSAANTADDIALAGEDCTDAVIEGLMVKVLQTIKTRTGKP
jgi:hypothetical protein